MFELVFFISKLKFLCWVSELLTILGHFVFLQRENQYPLSFEMRKLPFVKKLIWRTKTLPVWVYGSSLVNDYLFVKVLVYISKCSISCVFGNLSYSGRYFEVWRCSVLVFQLIMLLILHDFCFWILVPRSHIDDEYAYASQRDPKILITTSRDPSAPLIQFAKVGIASLLLYHTIFST